MVRRDVPDGRFWVEEVRGNVNRTEFPFESGPVPGGFRYPVGLPGGRGEEVSETFRVNMPDAAGQTELGFTS